MVSIFMLVTSLVTTTSAAQSDADDADFVHFLVDVSGSMGGAKLAQAKEALLSVGPSLGSESRVGLRKFAGSCGSPGELLVPISDFEEQSFNSAVNGLSAGGGTPTSAALTLAVTDFPSSSTNRTLVLIADGDDQCGDLCATVQDLVNQGVDVTIQAVGIQVGSSAASALECAANTSGGEYFPVEDLDGLTDAIGGAVGDDSFKWVAMGDSYSSGEGAAFFDAGTNVEGSNECRRSDAYSRVALRSLQDQVDEFMFVACSGARSYHIVPRDESDSAQYPDSPDEIYGGKFQIDYLDSSVDLVTISIGGNDVGFGDIIAACTGILGPKFLADGLDYELDWVLEFAKFAKKRDYAELARNCESYVHDEAGSFSEAVASGVENIETEVSNIIEAIKLRSPMARVLVVGYPQFIPGENLPTCGGLTGLDGQERTWARTIVSQLNNRVEAAALRQGVEFVDIEQEFETLGSTDGASHLICSSNEFANGISRPTNLSFHPNLKGHAELGDYVLACILDADRCNPPTPWLFCNGKEATIYGTDGPDQIRGLVGDDVIVTFGGDDEVAAKGDQGNDTICAGPGRDKISGGDGDDYIDGGEGNDTLFGDEGDDTIYGGNGNDTLHGKNGDDFLYGEDGNDQLLGGRSNGDYCDGGPGKDKAPGSLFSRSGCNTKVNVP